ncbi:hypothetical protein EAT07_08920 [Campylobacter coli]|nr:hypothetical protein [Campylobacter coli]
MKNFAYIINVFNMILKEENRDTIKYLQKILCTVILARYDDFVKIINPLIILSNIKHLKNVLLLFFK